MRRSPLLAVLAAAGLALAACGGSEPPVATATTSSAPEPDGPASPTDPPAGEAGDVPAPRVGAPGGFVRVSTPCYSVAVPVEAAAGLEGSDSCQISILYEGGLIAVFPESEDETIGELVAFASSIGDRPTSTDERIVDGAPGAVLRRVQTFDGVDETRYQVLVDVREEGLSDQGQPVSSFSILGSESFLERGTGTAEDDLVIFAVVDSLRFGAPNS